MAASTYFNIAIGMCAILMSTCRTHADSGASCPSFWTPFGEACYRLIAQPKPWTEAEAICQQLGNGIISGMESHLVSIHNQDESDFVQAYYASSLIIQGQRKKTPDPNSYNSLWLGLNNQGLNLDTFVWSDNTEISTTFWQDPQQNTAHTCGHTWTSSPSKYKGKWNAVSCNTKLPYMCKLQIQQDDTDATDESLEELKCNNITCPQIVCMQEPVKPIGQCCSVCPDESNSCYLRGKTLVVGETMTLSSCTSATCGNDAIIHIEIQPCEVTICRESINVDGECCNICPYDVPVYDIQLTGDGLDSVKAGTVNDISVDLQVSLTSEGQSVRGSSLWKVGMYASRYPDGSGKKIGYKQQILTDEQASKNMHRPPVFDGFEFRISDINFSLDASNATCKQLQYLCVSFNKGDAPVTVSRASHVLPLDVTRFEVYGVESREDSSPNPARLIRCQQFTTCADKEERRCLIYE